MVNFNYARIENRIYSIEECETIISEIAKNEKNNGFGIRYFIRDNPAVFKLLVNDALRLLLNKYFVNPCIVKSIYFDKPVNANWVVNWHQDITLNLNERIELPGFKNWRVLKDRVVVQPEVSVLESILTLRVHLDDANESNGALSVINNSENDGVIRAITDYVLENEDSKEVCCVRKGGVMVMSPLTVHSSRRSSSGNTRRRVIHLEIMEKELAGRLPFLECFPIDFS